jgi:hypothetical protein
MRFQVGDGVVDVLVDIDRFELPIAQFLPEAEIGPRTPEGKTGIAPFERLVDDVMHQPPCNQARRVSWIMDNGFSHRRARCVARLQAKYPRLVPVHGPVHASWLNQIEIYFSIVQRKVLTPNDFPTLAAVKQRLLAFQTHYEAMAQPFEWKFTRHDLAKLLNKFRSHSDPLLRIAA